MADLFDPLTLRGLTIRNRTGISPMCQYASTDGFVNDWHLVNLGSRAVGGAGLVIAEASGVEARGRITPGCLGIWKDEHVEGLARMAAFCKDHGAATAMQIAHAGRKASVHTPWDGDFSLSPDEGAWETVAPMAESFDGADGDIRHVPRAMDEADIAAVIEAFAQAARRSVEAGFEMVEIHGAHGYLIHQFYSPLTNRRDDAWGGSFTNRIKLVVEVTRACRRVMPDSMPLAIRLSCVDWAPGGWTLEDTVALAGILKSEGVDLIDCSSGFNVPGEDLPREPEWHVPFSRRLRDEASIATAAVGDIAAAGRANEIIRHGDADLALIATASLKDAHWPWHAAETLGLTDKITMPKNYDYVVRGNYSPSDW
ncbi:MAG: NADH:flavin oxidoreductase/NADH oxidase [Rhodospirillaceae bacterium]|nr:NADH:flavin oxidoreductase/NADH oxidase [Rhodospirillaceae bacterium]